MILQAITIHDKFIIILSRYIVCLDVCHALHDAHLVARIPRYSWIRVYNESKGNSSNFLENDNTRPLYCSLKKAPKLLTIHLPSKQETFWPLPLISPRYYCIHSFWSQHTEKRNNTISQMRLRSVFKMQTSILNTATTEQMGYGIISFFVCFPQMNQIVIHIYFTESSLTTLVIKAYNSLIDNNG